MDDSTITTHTLPHSSHTYIHHDTHTHTHTHTKKSMVNPLNGHTMDTSALSSRINMGQFSLGDVR